MNARLQQRTDWPYPGLTRLLELLRRACETLREWLVSRRAPDTSIAWEDGEREEDRRF